MAAGDVSRALGRVTGRQEANQQDQGEHWQEAAVTMTTLAQSSQTPTSRAHSVPPCSCPARPHTSTELGRCSSTIRHYLGQARKGIACLLLKSQHHIDSVCGTG